MSKPWIDRENPGIDPQEGSIVRVQLLDRGDARHLPLWGYYRWNEDANAYCGTGIRVEAHSWQHALIAFEKFEAKQAQMHQDLARAP